nr:magnesium transporter [bacterium]
MEQLQLFLQQKQYQALRAWLAEQNAVDLALAFEDLPLESQVLVFRLLTKEMAADVFAYLSNDRQQEIVDSISDRELHQLVEDLAIDDAVDFIEEMPASVVKKILQNAREDTRRLINQILQYPENSAGSIMTVEYVSLHRTMTVQQAFDRIRKTGVDKETIYTCFVTDEQRHLMGVVSVRTLLLNKMQDIVGDIMETHVQSVATTDDQETVATLFNKYDLLCMPVTDSENRLVGIITVDDVVDVIQEEATEDFEKMAAMVPSDKPYLKTSVFSLAKNRIVWLMVLMFSAMITGTLLEKYELAIQTMPLLVTFVPMLMDTGGNAGAQASTMIIRGMAMDEIHPRDVFVVWWKEIRVSLLVGVTLAAANYIRVMLQYPDADPLTPLVVAISLLGTVIMAKGAGCLLPILAKKCRLDPAIMAAPIITTLVDAFSLIFFFNISRLLLKI